MSKPKCTKLTMTGKKGTQISLNRSTKCTPTQVRVSEEQVTFQEIDHSETAAPTDKKYGSAINAPLAVHMISHFWNEVFSKAPHFEDFLKKKSFTDKTLSGRELEELYDWLLELLEASFAITFDKNLILRLLSQPQSEKLRLYLCLRDEQVTTSSPKKSASKRNDKGAQRNMSVIAVAADSQDRDLLYDYTPTNPLDGEPNLNKISNQSLLAEYGHPPTGLRKKLTNEKNIGKDPYVLFQYSRDFICKK